jgi:hypothetical protein
MEEKAYNSIKNIEQKNNFNLKNITMNSYLTSKAANKAEQDFIKKGEKATQRDFDYKEELIAKKNAYIKLENEIKIQNKPLPVVDKYKLRMDKIYENANTIEQFKHNQQVAENKKKEFDKKIEENKNNKEKAFKILNIKSPLRKATDFAFGLSNPGYRIASLALNGLNSSKEQYSKEQINWAKSFVKQYNDWERNSKFYGKEANKWKGFISTQEAIKNKRVSSLGENAQRSQW